MTGQPARRLYLVRHPRPLIDRGLCYGQLDVAAENPRALADTLRRQLPPGLPVWSSPLRRCRQLAECLHPATCCDDRLMEMNFGAWEGRPWHAVPRAELDAWAADIEAYAPPGGESPAALRRRVLDFVSTLPAGGHLLVTHAGVIRLLQAQVQGLSIADSLQIRPAYGSLTVVDWP